MRFRLVSLFAVTVAMSACSDDSSGPDASSLSREEALMIASAVSSSAQTSTTTSSARPMPNVTAAVPISFEHDVETSHPCPQGGTVNITVHATGTVDVEAGSAVLDVTGSQRHAACAFVHHGVTITLTGDPDLDFESHASILNQQPNAPFSVDVNGALNWSTSDNRSGRCVIAYEEVVDFVARRRTVDGSICGHVVRETFTWTAGS